jgi:hypothetical protein
MRRRIRASFWYVRITLRHALHPTDGILFSCLPETPWFSRPLTAYEEPPVQTAKAFSFSSFHSEPGFAAGTTPSRGAVRDERNIT